MCSAEAHTSFYLTVYLLIAMAILWSIVGYFVYTRVISLKRKRVNAESGGLAPSAGTSQGLSMDCCSQ